MSKQYNVAVIGYGWAATAHIAAINATAQAQVTAVWSSRPLDSAELSAKHGSPITAFTDLAAMLADPSIQVVDITSYPNQHAAQFIAAARNGKHIIVEKPLAIEWSEILQMKRAADESGVNVCVCFECRYSSQFLATKAKNSVDESGRVLHLSPIFKWYAADFEKKSGTVQKFVTPYFPAAPRAALARGDWRIHHTDYDWSLNEWKPAR